MRFLADRCVGRVLVEWLRREGHDVLDAREEGSDPGDRKLLLRAAAQQRVLITLDKDFGSFLYLERLAHAGLVRLPDVPAATRVSLVKGVLRQFPDGVPPNTVITVTEKRLRVTRSPAPLAGPGASNDA